MEDEILSIINQSIKEYNLEDKIKINAEDIGINADCIKIKDKRIFQGKNKDGFLVTKINADRTFENFFEHRSKDRQNDQGILYSFKKQEFVPELIKKEQMHLRSLNEQLYNDPLEYCDLINITNPLVMHIDKDNDKGKIFIYCFTKDFRNKIMWKKYGTNKANNKIENIAIGFRYHKKIDSAGLNKIIELRDVIYNIGNEFDFIRDIQLKLYYRFKRTLFIDSSQYFARFFKREKYSYEDEVRLCIDYNQYENLRELNKFYPGCFEYDFEKIILKEENNILIPLNNEFFYIEICELICGKDIEDSQYEYLSALAKEKEILIWKYDSDCDKNVTSGY